MKVLVTGGTGNLGSHVVRELTKRSDVQLRVMSLKAPDEGAARGIEWIVGDLEDEDVVTRVADGIDVIIHAASDYSIDPAHADVRTTDLLLRKAKAAGVKQFSYISIVGCDKVPLPYYGAKVQCEAAVRGSGLSWSIFRATQFHSLVDAAIKEYSKPLLLALMPVELCVQSVDEDEVAEKLVESALRCESGSVTEMSGPELLTLGAMANTWFRTRKKSAAVLPVTIPPLFDPNAGSGLAAEEQTWRIADAYRKGSQHLRRPLSQWKNYLGRMA